MKRLYSQRELPHSALLYVLESMVPYTDANLKLAFSPKLFFIELERIDRQKAWLREKRKRRQAKGKRNKPYTYETLRDAFYNSRKKGLIKLDEQGIPRLTAKGQGLIKPYKPKKLGRSARVIVVYDIPEEQRNKRQHVRALLRELKFTKLQQSVWMSEYDHRDYLRSEIKALGLEPYLHVYESVRLI